MAMPAYTPALFRDRPRHMQVLAGGIVPAALGGFLAGFEHRDGWGGADRGLIGGAIYGLFILLAHWAAGTHAKVSLGSFPPLLILITAIIAILLGAVGGRLARAQRERAGTAPPATHTS